MRAIRLLLAGAITLAISATLSLSAVAQSDDSPGDVSVVKDLVYAVDRADDGAERKLDAYVGAGGEDALLVVHSPGPAAPRRHALTHLYESNRLRL